MSDEKIKAIGDAAFGAFKEGIEGLIDGEKRDKLLELAKEKAAEGAKQIWKSQTEDTEAKRDEAKANVKHLRGHVKLAIADLALDLADGVEDILGNVLKAVIGAAASVFGLSP